MKTKLLFLFLFCFGIANAGVIRVTSTANTGTGTLREAVETLALNNDTILIDVKGPIFLESTIEFNGFTNLTVLGPGPKHSSIGGTAVFTGTSLLRVTNCSSVVFRFLGFQGGAPASVRLMSIDNNPSVIKIEQCVFKDVVFSGAGGAVSVLNSSVEIRGSSFVGNTALNGGGVALSNSTALVENCTFWNNNASNTGGAVYIENSSGITLVHNTFYQNTAGSAGFAFFSSGAVNSITVQSNAISENGTSPGQFSGGGAYVSNGGNKYHKNNGTDTTPWAASGTDDAQTTLVFNLRSTIVTDGYGLMYFPIVSQTSVLIDAGPPTGIPFDCRRAPRSLKSSNVSSAAPDAGACEYTPLRVTSTGGSVLTINSLPWAFASLQNINPVNYVEFDLSGFPITLLPDGQMTLQGNYIVDGFSQDGSAVPGPAPDATPGVTPAILPVTIGNLGGISNGFVVDSPSNATTIAGLRLVGFSGSGIFSFGANTVIEGCEIGINASNSSEPNAFSGIHVQGNNNRIGGKWHWQRNVISGNATGGGTNTEIYIDIAIPGTMIFGNIIGLNREGTDNFSGASCYYGILDLGNGTLVGDVGAGNLISGKSEGITCVGCQNLGVFSNTIGLDYNQTISKSNVNGIFILGGASNVMIGKPNPGGGNIISGNVSVQIRIDAVNGVAIKNNLIGPDKNGNTAPVTTTHGVYISEINANDVMIGGSNPAEKNIISGNQNGIYVIDVGIGCQILNNYIGLNKDGTAALPNSSIGIVVQGGVTNTIQIGLPGSGNVVSGQELAGGVGIAIVSPSSQIIQSNIIGLDPTGSFAIQNISGISVSAATGPIIGGDFSLGEGNIISGNQNGIIIQGASSGTLIRGNLIGTDITGTLPIGNEFAGITILDATNTTIGGASNYRNVISGSSTVGSNGIYLNGPTAGTQISCNYIGLNQSGNGSVPNYYGIAIEGNGTALIGGPPGFENYICASSNAGIWINSPLITKVDGNFIGLGPGGAFAGGGNLHGIHITNATAVIGELNNNIIANNAQHGIFIDGENADSVRIDGCYIGTNSLGIAGIGNGGDGIHISQSDTILIGLNAPNHIIGNTGSGIHLSGSVTQTFVESNLIYDFAGTGASNQYGVYIFSGPSNNFIGGVMGTSENTIGNNISDGIKIEEASQNVIRANRIGITSGSLAIPNQTGIRIFNANNNVIGEQNSIGNSTYNVISFNTGAGILLDNSDSNLIQGNTIGLDEAGTTDKPNEDGVVLSNLSEDNVVGGATDTRLRNTISGNDFVGVSISSPNNFVKLNFIGTDLSGTAAVGFQNYGVALNTGATNCQVGGDRPNEGNVIGANQVAGIYIVDQNNFVYGNLIGYSLSGTIIPNQPIGVLIESTQGLNNHVGDVAGGVEYGNIIMGHSNSGIVIENDAASNLITTNYIGIDPVSNATFTQNVGVKIDATAGDFNMIGEDVAGGGNIISGNSVGIELNGLTNALVYNNRIGTNVPGNLSASNLNHGIALMNSSQNTIGGPGLKGNVISGNLVSGIFMDGVSTIQNDVNGNIIGLSFDLINPVANDIGVFVSGGAGNNSIGTPGIGMGNIISGNATAGVVINASPDNAVFNNKIGLPLANKHGIIIQNGSVGNTIGGTFSQRNIISNNDSIAIAINSSNENIISGNFIGTNENGTLGFPNKIGVFILGGDLNEIGNVNQFNLVTGNTIAGIILEDANSNSIKNNFIGTDSTGNAIIGLTTNGAGIVIKNSSSNVIGGDESTGEINTISNNTAQGIYLEGSTLNEIYGNRIGISRNGLSYIGNGAEGIWLNLNSNNNIIGDVAPGYSNAIAANTKGILVNASSANNISSNFIGNDAVGLTASLTGTNNQTVGIHLGSGSENNLIQEVNVISGNTTNGIAITGPGTENNQVKGNRIGVDVAGSTGLPNGMANIYIADSAKFNFIGGPLIAERNHIGGDVPVQILIDNVADSNQISGNFIGLGIDETTTYTTNVGVRIKDNSRYNIIGGGTAGAGNTIVGFNQDGIHIYNSNYNSVLGNRIGIKPDNSNGAIDSSGILLEGADYTWIGSYLVGSDSMNIITNCNTGVGVTTLFALNSSYGNVIGGNSIYNNTNQGIDLVGDDLVMPIDTNNSNVFIDNGGMDRPEIVSAWTCGSDGFTHVGFKFYASNTLAGYHIEFYRNPVPDVSGYGEGEIYLGDFVFNPTTNYDTIAVNLGQTLPVGTVLTATITGVLGNTSEFSEQYIVTDPPTIGAPVVTDETCLGAGNGTAAVTAPDAYAFSWDGGLSWEYSSGGITSVLPAASYTLQALYLNGCELSTGVTLNPGPPLAFGYTAIPDTCGLGAGQIIIDTTSTNLAGGSGNYIYTFNGGIVYSGSIDSVSLGSGTYNVGLSDTTLGCLSTIDPVVVGEITDVADESFVFEDFCSGTTPLPSSVSTSGGVFSFEVIPVDGATIDASTGLISNAVTGNSYSVIYTVGICDEKDTISVTALAPDDATFTMDDFCSGSPQNIVVTGLTGGTFSFDPAPSDGALIDPVTGEISNSPGATYTVKYVTNGPCPDSTLVSVSVLPQPDMPDIIATDSVYCEGEILASLSVAAGTYTPNWMIGSSSSAVVATTTDFVPASLSFGDNYIYVVLSDGGTCVSLPDSINYILSDVSILTAGEDFQTCLGAEVQLNATGGVSYSWNPDDALSDSDIADPVAKINGESVFSVSITNDLGCTKTDSVHITLLPLADCNVDTYNAFSPNGDGTNDLWIIDGIEGYPENTVVVYNRWGDVLMRFEDYNNSSVIWDGSNNSGDSAPAGTYFFVVDVNGNQNQTGWVQVVR